MTLTTSMTNSLNKSPRPWLPPGIAKVAKKSRTTIHRMHFTLACAPKTSTHQSPTVLKPPLLASLPAQDHQPDTLVQGWRLRWRRRAVVRSTGKHAAFRACLRVTVKKSGGPSGGPPFSYEQVRLRCLDLLDLGDECGQRRFPRRHQAIVGDLENRSFGVLVDGDDDLRALHAGEVLNGAGQGDREVELGRHDFSGLADLQIVRHHAGVASGAAGTESTAEQVRQLFQCLEICGLLHSAAA